MDLQVVVNGDSYSCSDDAVRCDNIILCASEQDAEKQLLSANKGFVMLLNKDDTLSTNFWNKTEEYIKKFPDAEIIFCPRVYKKSHQTVAFSVLNRETGAVKEQELPFLHAWFLEGTIIRSDLVKKIFETDKYGQFSVMWGLLEIQKKAVTRGKMIWISDTSIEYAISHEGDKTFFPGVYQKKWYEELTSEYMMKRKKEAESGENLIDISEQYQMAFLINSAVEANLNNVNKHLFEGKEAEDFLLILGSCFEMIDNCVILDRNHFQIAGKNAYLRRWVYLILKNRDTSLEYDWIFENGKYYYGYDGVKAGLFDEITADIISMTYEKGRLTIEGRVSPLVYMNGGNFILYSNGQAVIPQKIERYALTKAFGVSIYKLQSFHVEVPVCEGMKTDISFVMEGSWGKNSVSLEFDSHFSRLTNRFKNNYWQMAHKTMMTAGNNSLHIRPAGGMKRAIKEVSLWFDMLKTGQKKVIKYIPVRFFILMKPMLKRKPVWLFIDKIYKAGDSSEYLWRYVKEHDKDVSAYYLLDKNCSDYKRMTEGGEKPLVRHSLAHRRAFLYADWVIISNSTVFAFNDFSTKNSAYIRDLIGFKVACVQHGMSVQKIAVAQNRLRDNISLYFCASKYEIENLSRPVYDYVGYDILKLTGVPRYDGLVSCDKRQILISPTWRMQAAVPVTKNESVMRDYNPLFRETSYFKVYNSLINDVRLLEAAKKYGYSIVYVLHPIVSAQIDDFDKNDQVTIMQGGGDVNYEKILSESSLMVTDYSGVQFDFAYMRKPVVYLHHKDIPEHYEEGTFFYDTMGFGEICTDNSQIIDVLIEYMSEGCHIKEKYKERVDDFFAYNDRHNCERIYREIKNKS